MNFKIFHTGILLMVILVFHLFGIFGGLYEKGIEIDAPQHVLGGMFLASLWLSVLSKSKLQISKPLIFISAVSFVALGAVVWEIFEFIVWKFFPVFASSFKFYSRTVNDLLGDQINNLLGGILVGFYAIRKKV